MSKATIADVARLAGVSIKTVSRVVNKEPNVRDDTRKKVEEAVTALGYHPNASARSLAGRRSYLIALLYDNPSASYLINIQNGSLKTCRAQGYDFLIHPCNYRDPGLVEDLLRMLSQSRVDGVILTPPLADMGSVISALEGQGTPFVRIAPADHGRDNGAVYTNDREACAEMTRYLASLGHERIGFLIGHPDHGAVGNRYLGYLDGLRSSGLHLSKELVCQGYNSFDSGQSCARTLLQLSDPPTAIFASNDDMAAGVIKVAHDTGIAIPKSLSVAGFDDVPLAGQIWPSLTTIRQPIEVMAKAVTETLLHQLRGHPDVPAEQVIESSLIVRESTGPSPDRQNESGGSSEGRRRMAPRSTAA